jgi:putative transposase
MLCGKCSNKKKEVNRTHIMFSLRAFLSMVLQKIWNKIFWAEGKTKIHRIEEWYL